MNRTILILMLLFCCATGRAQEALIKLMNELEKTYPGAKWDMEYDYDAKKKEGTLGKTFTIQKKDMRSADLKRLLSTFQSETSLATECVSLTHKHAGQDTTTFTLNYGGTIRVPGENGLLSGRSLQGGSASAFLDVGRWVQFSLDYPYRNRAATVKPDYADVGKLFAQMAAREGTRRSKVEYRGIIGYFDYEISNNVLHSDSTVGNKYIVSKVEKEDYGRIRDAMKKLIGLAVPVRVYLEDERLLMIDTKSGHAYAVRWTEEKSLALLDIRYRPGGCFCMPMYWPYFDYYNNDYVDSTLRQRIGNAACDEIKRRVAEIESKRNARRKPFSQKELKRALNSMRTSWEMVSFNMEYRDLSDDSTKQAVRKVMDPIVKDYQQLVK